jgi:hypothetical protein
MPREEITITLPDGKKLTGTSWETTPLELAAQLSASLSQKAIIAKINGTTLWDLNRPLESSCDLAILDFDSPDNNFEARQVFWHSSAHVLGEACERHLDDCCLGYGPPQETGGFFYEMRLKDNRSVLVVVRPHPFNQTDLLVTRKGQLPLPTTRRSRVSSSWLSRRSRTSRGWSCPRKLFWRCLL